MWKTFRAFQAGTGSFLASVLLTVAWSILRMPNEKTVMDTVSDDTKPCSAATITSLRIQRDELLIQRDRLLSALKQIAGVSQAAVDKYESQ